MSIVEYDQIENYLVAVIDILGIKKKISGEVEQETLNDLHYVFDFITNITNMNNEYKIKVYSDNIVIAKLFEEHKEDVNHEFLSFVSNCQWYIMTLGYLSRGAVTYGNFYIDQQMVWGKALVRAHELEEKDALYPRVIIDHILISNYKRWDIWSELLLSDKNDYFYLDYLSSGKDSELEAFPLVYDKIMDGANGISEINIQEKYEWFKEFHQRIHDVTQFNKAKKDYLEKHCFSDKEQNICNICMSNKLRNKAIKSLKNGCNESEFVNTLEQIARLERM